MGITERRLRQKEEVRTGILRAAWQLVQDDGWQSLSIRKIADAIEYSVPVIYDHFENKDAILMEFSKEGFSCLCDSMEEAKNKFEDPAQQLEAMGFAYWKFAFENKEYYQVMFGLGMSTCEIAKKIPEMARFGNLIQSTLKSIIGQSSDIDGFPFLKFNTFWSLLHGLVSLNMMGQSTAHAEMNQAILKDSINGFIKSLKG